MRKAGRAIGRFLGAGLAGTAKAAATGGLTYFGQRELTKRVDFLQKHPLAGPIGLIVAGHIAKKKFPIAGNSVVAAGTYGLALAYDLNKMSTSQPAATASGTNALIEPDDIRALVSPGEITGLDVDSGMANGPAMNLGDALAI